MSFRTSCIFALFSVYTYNYHPVFYVRPTGILLFHEENSSSDRVVAYLLRRGIYIYIYYYYVHVPTSKMEFQTELNICRAEMHMRATYTVIRNYFVPKNPIFGKYSSL